MWHTIAMPTVGWLYIPFCNFAPVWVNVLITIWIEAQFVAKLQLGAKPSLTCSLHGTRVIKEIVILGHWDLRIVYAAEPIKIALAYLFHNFFAIIIL